MFHNLTGYPGWRLTDILIKDRNGQAAAFGLDDPKGVCPYLAERMATQRGKSVMVADGPVKENRMLGKEVNLHKLPIPQHSVGDGGRYLGSGLTITKDPETGIRNESIIRMMLTEDPQKATFWMAARHNYAHYLKYVAKDEPMPMAFAIGMHPVYEIMSNWSGRHEDFDELEYGAGILGEDIEMVKCDTIDLEVPAHAEIVIEPRPPARPRARRAVRRVHHLRLGRRGAGAGLPDHRHHPSRRPDLPPYAATWFTDHQPLITLPMEATTTTGCATPMATPTSRTYSSALGVQFMMIVQMEAKWDGQARDVLMSALTGPNLHVKVAIAVDDDVDIYNAEDVLWAIACRTNPAEMVHIMPGSRLHPLDVSIPEVGDEYTVMRIGGKMAIDATKPATWRPRSAPIWPASIRWGRAIPRSAASSNRCACRARAAARPAAEARQWPASSPYPGAS